MFKTLAILLFCCSFSLFAQHNTVTEIEFIGLKRTKPSFIKKIITLKIGNILDTALIKNDIKRLTHLVSIAKASYQIKLISGTSYKVTYLLDENFTLIPQLNIWTVDQTPSFIIGLYEYNLLGKNIKLGGFYQYNKFHSYGVSFNAPYLFSKKFGLAINFRNWTSEEPLYFNTFVANYKYNNVSYEAIGLYELNIKNRIAFGATYFTEKYNYINNAPPASEILIPLSVEQDKSMLKFNYNYSNVSYNYYLLSGFKSNFYFQAVVTENNYQEQFFIGWNDFLLYKQVGLKGNFATRLRVGLASNSESPFAPFTLDNNVNIRGVGFAIDRGTGSIVWNIEYRQTIIERDWFALQANLFTDAGSWRNPGGGLDDFTNSDNMRIYAGGGLRFIHKKIYNAIFRIDYGNSIIHTNSGGLVIGIGQYF